MLSRSGFASAVVAALLSGCSSIHRQPEAIDPVLADLVDYRTGLAMLREGRADEAIQLLNRSKTTNPRDANIPNALGLALLYKKDYTAAAKAFSDALKIDSAFVEARNNRGVCYIEAGKLNEAATDFEAVLDGPPNTQKIHAHYNLGLVHSKRTEWVRAEREFSLAIVDMPDYENALRERGLARVRLEHFHEALEDFLAVLRMDSKDPVSNYNAALCLLTTGRRDLAARYMERVATIAPETDEGRKARRFLDSEPSSRPNEEAR